MRSMVFLYGICLMAVAHALAFEALFDARIDYAVGAYPAAVVASDLDGDGDIDLAVTNYGSGDVSILSNHGDGTFAPT